MPTLRYPACTERCPSARKPMLGSGLPPPSPPAASGRIPVWWHRRSLRVQLLIVFVLIDLVAAAVAGCGDHLEGAHLDAGRDRRLDGAGRTFGGRSGRLDAAGGPCRTLPRGPAFAIAAGTACAHRGEGCGRPATRRARRRRSSNDDRASPPRWFAALIAPQAEGRRRPGPGQRHRRSARSISSASRPTRSRRSGKTPPRWPPSRCCLISQ